MPLIYELCDNLRIIVQSNVVRNPKEVVLITFSKILYGAEKRPRIAPVKVGKITYLEVDIIVLKTIVF